MTNDKPDLVNPGPGLHRVGNSSFVQGKGFLIDYSSGQPQIAVFSKGVDSGLASLGGEHTQQELEAEGFFSVFDEGTSAVYCKSLDDVSLWVVVAEGRLSGTYATSDPERDWSKTSSTLLPGASILGTADHRYRDWKDNESIWQGIRVRNDWVEFTLVASAFKGEWFPVDAKLLREPTAVEVGLETVIPSSSGGFNIGQENDTENIRGLRTINSVPVSKLNRVMQAGSTADSGFLGPNESVLDVMARDNDVVREAGLTHAEIAEPLRKINRMADLGLIDGNGKPSDGIVIIDGERYGVQYVDWMGIVNSPFEDGTSGSRDFTITNMKTRKVVSFPELAIDMIANYGFYEGRKCPYRVAPEAIVRVFDHMGNRAPAMQAIAKSVDASLRSMSNGKPGSGHQLS